MASLMISTWKLRLQVRKRSHKDGVLPTLSSIPTAWRMPLQHLCTALSPHLHGTQTHNPQPV